MRATSHHSTGRASRKSKATAKPDYEQALRACEGAAGRIKSASDELAASWAALCQELSQGASATDLLRKRAWCNVLELRLKEQAHALEDARQTVDRLWDDMLIARRARELFNRFLKHDAGEAIAGESGVSLLSRAASAIAAEHGDSVQLKK
jgi:flagellar biosynthesis chaperone FliJ